MMLLQWSMMPIGKAFWSFTLKLRQLFCELYGKSTLQQFVTALMDENNTEPVYTDFRAWVQYVQETPRPRADAVPPELRSVFV